MTTTTYVSAEMKNNFVLERLLAAVVTHSQQGVSVRELEYEDMKYELVLLSFREIDTENENNEWF